MSTDEQRSLATTVAKQSQGVSVKMGCTNGRNLLHLINRTLRQSRTIYSAAEWAFHDWNVPYQKERRRAAAEAA